MVSVAWDYYKNFHMSSKRTHNLHFSPRNTWCPQNDHKNFKVYSALDHFVDIKCFWCFATNTQLRRNPSEAMLYQQHMHMDCGTISCLRIFQKISTTLTLSYARPAYPASNVSSLNASSFVIH